MEIRTNIHIFCLVILLLTGCTYYTQVWEKRGGSQHSFNLDSRECEYIANQVSLQQSETGRRGDPAAFSKAYSECLEAKGWREKTVAAEIEKEETPDAVQQIAETINKTTMRGFGQTVTVTDTYSLSAQKRLQGGPTAIEQFSWKGEDGSFINILFQKNSVTPFKRMPYPVSEPFLLYTSGIGEKAQERLQWATFFRQTGTNWVMVTGAYYYVNKKERIIIVITKPLASPAGPVAEKATLAKNQYLEVEEFSKQWKTWLNKQFTHGPGLWEKIKKNFRYGM